MSDRPNLHIEDVMREDNFGELTQEFADGFASALKLLRNSFGGLSASQIDREWLLEVLDAHLEEVKAIQRRGNFDA